MADVKISGLPASTVPLAGTEVLPIVQGGTTKQVSIANVTAGRSVAALSVITPTIQAEAGSAGGTIKNGSGVAQMQWGSGGASNLSLEVATNINPANAAVNISPTGTGTVTINPATASNMNNVAIGGTTPLAGKFTTLEATGVTTVAAGTVSAPAITTTGDTNTGIFFPAADTIAFAEGGAEAMRLFSSSGVSIGNTTDPGATNLSVTGRTSSASFVPTGSAVATNGMYLPAANEVAISTNTTQRMRFLSDGTVLCGTSDSSFFANNVVGTGLFGTNGFISAARGGAPAGVFNRFTSDGEIVQFRREGSVVGSVNVTTLATTYTSISDYRLKNNPQPLVNSGAFIDSLQPKTWQWLMDGSTGVGFIAHEVQAVSPTTVTGAYDELDKDGNPKYQSMEYGSAEFIANMIAELKSLRLRVAALESK
jgi:hypothetical protein